mgnify:CR=1 FL=1
MPFANEYKQYGYSEEFLIHSTLEGREYAIAPEYDDIAASNLPEIYDYYVCGVNTYEDVLQASISKEWG